MPAPQRLAATWGIEFFLIATTMLVVGLFAVLSWDSMFPDRRDVLVLAPLPVRARTLFLAKVAAVATALSLTVAALHSLAGLVWPLVLAPAHAGFLGVIRSFAAYWITMLSAGAFVLCSLLCVQGLAALLPRQQFLRISAILQIAAFCLLLCVYFLQPTLVTPEALTAPRNQRLLAWLPAYWFLGLFQTLNGTAHPALTPLAWRAAISLAIAVVGAGVAFLLSYLRTLRKIIEEPDITPGARGGRWLPPFGSPPLTAVAQFSIRTLLRSRQHRLILSFFLGLAFTIVILYVKTPLAQRNLLNTPGTDPWRQANVPLLVSSIVMMWFAVIGTRVVFAMPTELRANWIFRIDQCSRSGGLLESDPAVAVHPRRGAGLDDLGRGASVAVALAAGRGPFGRAGTSRGDSGRGLPVRLSQDSLHLLVPAGEGQRLLPFLRIYDAVGHFPGQGSGTGAERAPEPGPVHHGVVCPEYLGRLGEMAHAGRSLNRRERNCGLRNWRLRQFWNWGCIATERSRWNLRPHDPSRQSRPRSNSGSGRTGLTGWS